MSELDKQLGKGKGPMNQRHLKLVDQQGEGKTPSSEQMQSAIPPITSNKLKHGEASELLFGTLGENDAYRGKRLEEQRERANANRHIEPRED